MTVSSFSSAARRHDIDPLELYASAIDTSDYVARIVPQVQRLVPEVGRLLDVGAGGGQLGAALQDRALPWTAVEPSPTMRARLARLHVPPRVVPEGWEEPASLRARTTPCSRQPCPPCSIGLRAIPRRAAAVWARRSVVWIVPAHAGPRGLCFAGCLPSEWHREDETPGLDIVLRGLGAASRPRAMAFADWTFSGVVQDLPKLSAYLADRLGWSASDNRRAALTVHLAAQALPDAAGVRLNIPRKSAVLVWEKS